jgi:dihydrofolate synthase/folylpolyglutamate synthase
MRLSTVSQWLSCIESLHATEIDLGLDRVKAVARRLNILAPACPVIIVGGTNGKGSTVAGLESIYRAAGYKTGAFTSPFLFVYNEQMRLDGEMVSDEQLCVAFAKVDEARGEISLTPFEFTTLAALYLFRQSALDIWILEVGLGGRLDAVNILDADVAIVTSISIDHVNWLGNTREEIAYEKAGIFREEKPAICGDFHPPVTLLAAAEKLKVPLYQQGRDFGFKDCSFKDSSFTDINFKETGEAWEWQGILHHPNSLSLVGSAEDFLSNTQGLLGSAGNSPEQAGLEAAFLDQDQLETAFTVFYTKLPKNTLALQNMSSVLMAVTLLQNKLPVSHEQIAKGLKQVELKGRIQIIPGEITEIFDVSHNPESVELLKEKLIAMPCSGKTWAVFSMLADKDLGSSLSIIKNEIDLWHVAPLKTKRAAGKELLEKTFYEAKIKNVLFYSSIAQAYEQAFHSAKPGDRIIIFGSFHTIAEAALIARAHISTL